MTRLIFSISIALLSFLNVNAQDQRVMTPLDVARIEQASGAVYSDDGNYIAYTRRIQADPMKENAAAHYELNLYNVRTGTSTPFITRGSVSGVEFRPGHSSITFLNRLEGDKSATLYEISLNGGEASKLLSFETSVSSYDWSPDGRMLAFVATEPKAETTSDLPYQPEIYEGELPFKRAYMFTPGEGEVKPFGLEGHVSLAKWSPDGNRLVMVIAKSPLVDDTYMEKTIHIVDRNSMRSTATVDHAGKLGDVCWSPTGGDLAFIAGADKNDPIDGRLFVVSDKGGKPKMLKEGWQGAFEAIEWLHPEYISYLGSKGTATVYGTVSPVGQKNYTTETVADGLSISSIDFIADGSMAFIADSWRHPYELFLSKSDSKSIERITHSNPWLDEIALGKQEVVKYKASDGLEIEGILIHPVNQEADKTYPLIVYVHGGPEAHVDNGWLTAYSQPGQVAAGKGYAVFYPNYRGSTGRGHEFTISSQGDPAGKEFDDIVDGVDYLIGTGLVDKAKVGVTGGSYGGYATGWFATRYTDRFAAGVMFVGISDKVSKWGTTDIPNEEYLVHSRKWVYEDYDFFLKRSPIYYAGQCRTPLLIMHGKEDTRVHPSQSMELYRHVKSRTNTPVSLVFYPGEGHGNARATARYDYNVRLMEWFDTHLKQEKDRS